MMGKLVFLVLFGMLCFFSRSLSANLERLMDNVVVLRVRDIDGSEVPVDISCGEAFEGHPVIWKKNDYIHCSTPNYRGSFNCHWTKKKIRSDASVLLVKGHRNQESVPCEVESSGSRMWCDDMNCPYKEEQHQISVTVYMSSMWRLEAYTKAFYLRDIVTPGRLPNLHFVKENNDDNNNSVFKWDYPESWQKPSSYFSLLFQVKVVARGETCHSEEHIRMNVTSQTEYTVDVKARRYVFCVRAQDKHTGGPWSHWSNCSMNSPNGGTPCEQRQTA
ncbi:hypothetical protein WMY93_008195 [Mugilogobius chulae]|uniref:Interleukin-12 subunit beta n=1 Tax=Mugilogobius chulae TaxID=88201 RepID=A0AAW0PIT4_9GOBI